MIEKKKRNELLTEYFKPTEEVLINACELVRELQEKDSLERALKIATSRVFDLKEALECARGELMYPSYKKFEVRG